ncbi:MAG: hypothetical protein SFT90_08355 [Rickettsiales bacterium]|nr:hypothetical protein [Rickettsiales bacterium]
MTDNYKIKKKENPYYNLSKEAFAEKADYTKLFLESCKKVLSYEITLNIKNGLVNKEPVKVLFKKINDINSANKLNSKASYSEYNWSQLDKYLNNIWKFRDDVSLIFSYADKNRQAFEKDVLEFLDFYRNGKTIYEFQERKLFDESLSYSLANSVIKNDRGLN